MSLALRAVAAVYVYSSPAGGECVTLRLADGFLRLRSAASACIAASIAASSSALCAAARRAANAAARLDEARVAPAVGVEALSRTMPRV